jgi:hypothetical protein
MPTLAQDPVSQARILEKVDESQLVTLKGNTVPAANAQNDLGPVRSSLVLTDVRLVLTRSPEQQAAFDEFVASQYDSTSPNFHRWLLPAQVGERFGPAQADIATVSQWLQSRGFSVAGVAPDRMTIRFSGTAAQVRSAFHTEMHRLMVRGQSHIANMSDPQIPAAMAPVVAGIKGLHDFRPHPLHKLGAQASLNNQTGKWQRISGAGTSVKSLTPNSLAAHPDFGITVGTGSSAYQIEDVAPYDFATIYNVLPLWNSSTPINGTDQVIAVAGTSDLTLADVATFRSIFGLPAGLTPVEVKGANGLDPGVCTSTDPTQPCNINDLTENTLDVEWAGAVATGAQIVLVTSGIQSATDDTVYDSSDYIVQNAGVSTSPVANAHILSLSYGLCELAEGTSGNTAYNNLWQTAATEGIAVIVPTGDAGSAACDQGLDSASTPYEAQYGLSVSGLASTPYDTAVGGTDLNWGTTPSPYWNATNSTGDASAAGYMPEVVWNDTCTNPQTIAFLQNQVVPALQGAGYSPTNPTDAESSCQFVITWYQTVSTEFGVDISGFVDVAGAGGGVSSCTSSDGQTVASCTGGYAKPAWQANIAGIPTDGKRDLPDVSLFASNGILGSAYLICVSAAGSCTYSTTTEPVAQEVGGTSVGAPAMAGIVALINQRNGVQGNPNAELYALAAKQTYSTCAAETGKTTSSCYFNDIDTGTIAMPCQAGTPNCTAIHSGDTVGVLPGYNATGGFDLATGLGSPNVANIVNAWVTTTGATTSSITENPSATTLFADVALTVTGSVATAGSTEPPTGNVVVSGGGYTSAPASLSNGSYSVTIPASSLAAGSDTLTATYAGDLFYAPATATATVTVNKLTPGGISVTPGATSIPSSATLTVTGSVAASTGGPTPAGTVILSGGGYTSSATTLSGGNYSISIPAASLGVGADVLTATYGGDANYLAATNSATVTVSSSFALTATAPAAVTRGSSATSTVTVNSKDSYAGTVTFTCALNSGGPANQAGDAPACSVSTAAVAAGATATATVTTAAATTSALRRPDFHLNRTSLAGLGSAALALLALLGIPAQRRAFRTFLGVFTLVVLLGSLSACGGGGGGGSSGGGGGTTTTNPGTASGTYTFTVTGTGTPAITPAPSTTFTVTVN